MKSLISITLFLLSMNFIAQVKAEDIEAHAGKELFKENCMGSCHKHDTDELLLREDSIVKDRQDLSRVVSFCVSNIGIEIFPEDKKLIADFLNKKFYKFE